MEQRSRYNMESGNKLNHGIQALPTATEVYFPVEGADKNKYKAIVVNGEVVNVPKKGYNLIQHSKAFRPIIEGITQAGIKDFKYVLWNTNTKAELQLYLEDDVFDTVSIGFTVQNSFDSSQAIRYGFKMNKRTSTLELVGYRQVCSNGMKIQVPLDKAEFVRPEIRVKLEELFNKNTRILHTKTADAKIAQMQYYAEALALLKEPVKLIINKAQKFELKNKVLLKKLIEFHVGKRMTKKVVDQFSNESQDLWGLYNAITYIASHDDGIMDITRENLIDKASNMLSNELVVKVPA